MLRRIPVAANHLALVQPDGNAFAFRLTFSMETSPIFQGDNADIGQSP
jgi:hypothetical protein